MRPKLLVGVGVVAVAMLSTGIAEAAEKTAASYEVPVIQPEGVAYHAPSRTFFTGAGFEGTIARGSIDEPTAAVYSHSELTGRNAALGMLTDDEHLYVAGGGTGNLYVYDIASKAEVTHYSTGPGGAINDLDFAPNGDLYFTDSFRPAIYRVKHGTEAIETIHLDPEVDYTPQPVQAGPFNVNGIRVSEDGKHVLFNDTNDSMLYSMTVTENVADRVISKIALPAGTLNGPDGIELLGQTAYVVNNTGETISKITMSDDFLTGELISQTTNPDFHTPATIAYVKERNQLLVTNPEFFDPTGAGPPFYVIAIPLP